MNSAFGDSGDAAGMGRNNGNKKIAPSPVTRNSSDYNMSHPRRGLAIIINNENFDISSLKSRTGTNVDCENLKQTLSNLNFDVRVYVDSTLRDIRSIFNEVSQFDHTDHDCLLVSILSHGEMGMIYARDASYKLESIWTLFTADRCPTLAGKPKLFFIQACQGDQLDGGVTLVERDSSGSTGLQYKIPTHADFLIAYSTIPGFYSWRNTTRGSWFMQALCQEINANSKHTDLLTMLTFTLQRVALDFESNTPDIPQMHQQKQIPCFTSMLTRRLFFR